MDSPADISLPFFAYGIFKPGQLGFCQLKELVHGMAQPGQIQGALRLRDGLPIIDPSGNALVKGVLVKFHTDRAAEAYARIAALEPDKHYRWGQTAAVGGTLANVLFGRSPRKGSIPCEEDEWTGWDDPLFTSALDVVEEALNSNKQFEWDLKPLFRLQMAYLLLWSAIERYVSLRYHFGDRVVEKVRHLAEEQAFVEGVGQAVNERREVYRADRPDQRVVLDATSPGGSLDYYYQIRSNITHRGKGVVRDHDRVLEALEQLCPIFRSVLAAARVDAEANV